ncbi:endonuclease/exonuclease/phosphatase family protein [Roseimaritima ulvae]|uniref:Endonuclease/Exonuclease/phosphatase family protein n=1 Tax=Roseimaritima ulvae TaxID=980254 RepID=A0A5B9QPM4_9BACT|nr:endonuclease/exonuclease/phosphatase family protein [Roseimaritima ulvae]QEG39465.1 Endonuclease/Exonuclease/phosphatase family protein [Roseimaritima ulvae]
MFWKKKRSRSTKSRLPWTRFIGPGVTIVGLLSLLGFGVGKGVDFSKLDTDLVSASTELDGSTVTTPIVGSGKRADRIRIASFNIQVFGEKKSSDPNVMGVLASIMTHFDLVAIQEVRSPKSQPVQRLVDQINASGGQYASIVSPSLGRTSQTEQYAFVWDVTRIRMIPDSSYVVSDPEDRMHREPMAATFQSIVAASSGRSGFKFTLINAHTDPDEVLHDGPDNELNVLDDVYLSIREYEYARQGEEDFVLLGDLNVDREHLYELGAIHGIESVVGDVPTNTAGTKVYDHILVDRATTSEFTGTAGVIDFVKDLNLTKEQALLVSDHLPIWAEFSIYEQPAFAAVATRPSSSAPQR